LICFAVYTGQISPNLGSNAYSIANFDGGHFTTNLDGFADDLFE
jgi:hypothetical protein